MKKFKNTLAALAGAGFLIAQPAAAANASVERSGTALSTAEEQAEGLSFVWVFGALVVLAVVAELTGVIDIIGDDDPQSP